MKRVIYIDFRNIVTKYVTYLIWGVLSIFFLFITFYQGYEVIKKLFETDILDLEKVGNMILTFEFVLSGLMAIREGGHFPLRYLVTFAISAIIFYIAVNKSSIEPLMFVVFIGSIICLSLLYLHLKSVSKKSRLEEWKFLKTPSFSLEFFLFELLIIKVCISFVSMVTPPRLELGTYCLRGKCSTNWAIESSKWKEFIYFFKKVKKNLTFLSPFLI